MVRSRVRALSSAEERCLHTAEVTSSILVAPTGVSFDAPFGGAFCVVSVDCRGKTPNPWGTYVAGSHDMGRAGEMAAIEGGGTCVG